MKMSKIIITFFILVSLVFAGEYGDSFLNLGVSARNLAMGMSGGALDRTNTSFLSNPAGMAYVSSLNINMMYMDQFGLAQYNYLGGSIPVSKTSTISINWLHYGVSNIPRRPDYFLSGDYSPEKIREEILQHKGKGFGYFSDKEDALFISFSKMFTYDLFMEWMYKILRIEIPIGANVKMIKKQLDTSEAFGLGTDFGARIKFSFGQIANNKLGALSFGLTLQDFTTTHVYWNTEHLDEIPINMKSSVAFEQPISFLKSHIVVSAEKNTHYNKNIRYGLEYQFLNLLAFRAGVNEEQLNFGCGLNFKIFSLKTIIDYAFLRHDLGDCHRIGLALCLIK